jgi:hypothetical protein
MRTLLVILSIITVCQAGFYASVCSKTKGFFTVLVSGVCVIDNWEIVMTDYDTYSLFVNSDGHDQSGYNVEVYRYSTGSATYAKSMTIKFPDGSEKSYNFDKSDYCDADGRKYYSWSSQISNEQQAWAYSYCHDWCSTEPN